MKKTLMVVWVAAAALLAGCGGGSDESNAPVELVSELPPAEGEVDHLNWALPAGEPSFIDPTRGSDFSPTLVSSNLCEPLMKVNPDFSLSPNLATKVDQPDPKTLVYTLRDDVRFWDGAPMTAEDAAYSLQYAARPQSYVSFFFTNVESIEATGKYEVTVQFKTPDALFPLEMGGSTGAVMQKEFTEDAGDAVGTPDGGLMCTGPFKLDSWKSGQSIELTRNDDYWGEPAFAKSVSLKFLSDSSALSQALVSGEVDGAYEVPAAIVPALRNSDTGTFYAGPSTQYLEIFALRPDNPLADDDVRNALFYSLDREAIADAIFSGLGEPNYTLLAKNSWDAPNKDLWEAAYPEWEEANDIDTETAKSMVESAGADGETIKLVVGAGDATGSQLAQLVQEQGKKLGLDVEISTEQPTQYANLFVDPEARGEYDMSIGTSFNGIPNALEIYPIQILSDSFYNYAGFSDKRVDELVEEARRTIDAHDRGELLVEAQSLIEGKHPSTSLLALPEMMYLNDKYTGAITSFAYLSRPSLAYIGAAGEE